MPDDGSTDEEVLERAVELVSRGEIAQRRAELQQLVGSIAPGLKASTVAGEVDDLVTLLNRAVRARTQRQRARFAVQVLTFGEGAAALWAPPVGLASGPTAAVGEALIQRRWNPPAEVGTGAVELLAQAQRALS